MHHLLLGLLVLLAGCAATQPTYVPPPAPTPAAVSYYLLIDQDWVELAPDLFVKREGSWDGSPRYRHFWMKAYLKNTFAKLEAIVDCQARTKVTLQAVEYDRQGNVMDAWKAPVRQFAPAGERAITPDTNSSVAADFVCQPPEAR